MAFQCQCGEPFNIVAALDSLTSEELGSSGHGGAKCPQCSRYVEFQLHSRRVDIGYSYSAGAMHFEAMATKKYRALTVVSSEPDDLDVQLGDRHWHFGVRRESQLRCCVQGDAWARGRRAADLDFAQWNVRFEAVEREGVRRAPADTPKIEEGDFLHLAGPAPALSRAWRYVNDGRDRTAGR